MVVSVRITKDICHLTYHLLVTKTSVEKCFLTCLYKAPNQNGYELETFCSDSNFLLNNIKKLQLLCSIPVGDFNAKLSKWCTADKNNIKLESH